jgi:hypothetical protein
LADTLEDRAVKLMLQRKPKTAKVERLRKRDNDEFATLRRKAARWAADNFDRLADPDPKIPDALNDRAADNWRPLLAIADLAGGDWPKRARESACILSGDGQDTSAANVELLADIRKAFGDHAVIRSADLVAALVAEVERPWAEYNRGKPISQRQLAKLLGAFGIISNTVHPLGLPQGKGYRRADFEETWEAYCPGQIASHTDFDVSIRTNVQVPVESAQVSDFASVPEGSAYGLKNGKLSYRHADLYGCTDRKLKSGGEDDSATGNAPLSTVDGRSDYPDLPEFLRRPPNSGNGFAPPRCDHCGRPATSGQRWNWPGRPDGVVLHSSCEGPWFDTQSRWRQ